MFLEARMSAANSNIIMYGPSVPCQRNINLDSFSVEAPHLESKCLVTVVILSLLVEKAGVAPDVTLRFTTCKQVRMRAREPPWLWNPWGGSHEVQNRGNQWLHKMDLGATKIKKKNFLASLFWEHITNLRQSKLIGILLGTWPITRSAPCHVHSCVTVLVTKWDLITQLTVTLRARAEGPFTLSE